VRSRDDIRRWRLDREGALIAGRQAILQGEHHRARALIRK
jgi:hypothetical protein